MAKTNKRMGRPRLPRKEVRGRVVSARLRPEEAAEVTNAIRKSGMPSAEWIRGALLTVARREAGAEAAGR